MPHTSITPESRGVSFEGFLGGGSVDSCEKHLPLTGYARQQVPNWINRTHQAASEVLTSLSLPIPLQVISCFGLSVVTRRYVGFAVVALLVEINSIFLHLRQMLRMAGGGKTTPYRVNSMLNLGTYVVFRISTLAWMTRWLVLNRDHVPLISYTIGSVGMAIMTAMNIVLFYRLLRSDFLQTGREGRKEK
ncbi:hypothetical protein JZ751_009358 [Albula glossodonta]|uniref:TLC domain-containing protein n=1 Tax=Albula glossodonta TaxID=121402 RepID=A0A8T2N0K3_9TELE|nr:hypothetical protein JZ751_009358 [Albula glossodonta]